MQLVGAILETYPRNTSAAAGVFVSKRAELRHQQEAQLPQRGRATLRIIEYFAKSVKVTQGQ